MSREELVEAYLRGDISRRVFIRRLVAAGVSLSAAIAYAQISAQRAEATETNNANGLCSFYEEPCKVTFGGRIQTASGDRATFGGNAQHGKSGPKGQHTYHDHGPNTPIKVKSLTVECVSCAGNRATIIGLARVNNSTTARYRIDVTDAGEPGRSDTYRIRLTNGATYDSGEKPLLGGNVQIHKQ